jgi:isochorismate synthase
MTPPEPARPAGSAPSAGAVGGEPLSRSVPVPLAARVDPRALVAPDSVYLSGPELTLVGWGEPLELRLPGGLADRDARRAAVACLQALSGDDPRSRPVALGALPFDPRTPCRLVVPELLYVSDGRTARLVRTSSDPRALTATEAAELIGRRRSATAAPRASGAETGSAAGSELDVTARPEPHRFVEAIAQALGEIATGRLSKVVLARCLDVKLPVAPAPEKVLGELPAPDRASMTFFVPLASGHFLGASPELIVARKGRDVTSRPMAGTARVGPARDAGGRIRAGADALLGSPKNREEHRLLVEAIVETLRPRCSELEVPDEPEVVDWGTDARLGTSLQGRLATGPDGRLPDALELLAELHPTPAVGGVPAPSALELITRLEPFGRGNWAGPVGWIDSTGDGTWMLGIRSITLRDRAARVWAGVGIVRGSDPEEELGETVLKLDPFVEALEKASAAPV